MTKEEKDAKKKKLAAALAKLDTDDDSGDGDDGEEADPKEAKMIDLIAKGVDKAITKRIGRGKQPPTRDEKGWMEQLAEAFGVKE